jgi:hypothetical protein
VVVSIETIAETAKVEFTKAKIKVEQVEILEAMTILV